MSTADPAAVGVDIGAVLTKVVRLGEPPVVTRTPAPGELDRFVARLLGRYGPTPVGVAGGTSRVSFPGAPRFVPGVLCAAAVRQHRLGEPPSRRMLLICDAGARTTAAAVCAADGTKLVRLVRAVHAASPDVGARFGEPMEWLVNQSVARARRARIVLDRAATDERYRATPVYWGPDRAVTAEVALAALRPVADRAARLVRELIDAPGVPPVGEVVLTGVFGALQPVRETVLVVAGGDLPVTVLEPSAVAEGAGLVAAGVLAAEDDYPHTVGVLAHRVRHGLLADTVVTLAEAGRPLAGDAATVVLTVPGDLPGPLPVRLRVGGSGSWRDWRTESEVRPPAGEYAVTVVPGATSTGVLLLTPASGGPPLRCPLVEVPDGEGRP